MAWLHIPNESSACVPESVDLMSASDWRCRTLASSVTWNGKHTPSSTWLRRWRRVSWTLPLFGMILPRSTANRGAARWIGSLGVSPASRIAWPDQNSARTTIETYGLTQRELSEQSDPTRFLLRTWRESFATTGIASGQTYKQWATALRKDCSRRKRSAHRTAGNGYSYWLTPTADYSTSDTGEWRGTYYVRENGAKVSATLAHQTVNLQLWATPTKEGNRNRKDYNANSGDGLETQAKMFVLAQDEPAPPSMFPTPLAHDVNMAGADSRQSLKLADFVRMFPTPSARDWKDWDGDGKASPSRPYSAYSHLNRTTLMPGHTCSKACRRLNPLFVESLMGVPIGWTLLASADSDYRRWATVWSLWWRLMRSALLQLGQ